ncbi:MAG: hypothetical protein ACKVQW_10130 [Pyrinomonadaceae bacterium]
MAISINNDSGNIFAGGDGSDGDLVLRATDGTDRIRLDAGGGNMWLGGNGADGDIVLFAPSGDNATLEQATIHLDGDRGNISAGGQGTDGDLFLRAIDGTDRIRLDAGGGNIWLGGNGADGDLVLFASGGDNTTLGEATIHLNGSAGDIILQNADCAEDFEIDEVECVDPGTVMVIGENSRLSVSRTAYDRRVAGVVAGAETCRPGIILGRKGDVTNALPIALVGRTFCKVDAGYGAVNIGDLLTTSATPGHAMKVGDPANAFGAVIGKALGELRSGTGFVPILIALQ